MNIYRIWFKGHVQSFKSYSIYIHALCMTAMNTEEERSNNYKVIYDMYVVCRFTFEPRQKKKRFTFEHHMFLSVFKMKDKRTKLISTQNGSQLNHMTINLRKFCTIQIFSQWKSAKKQRSWKRKVFINWLIFSNLKVLVDIWALIFLFLFKKKKEN